MERTYPEYGDVLYEGGQLDASVMDDASEEEKGNNFIHGEHV